LNELKAISKPPILVGTNPIERGKGPTIATVGVLMAVVGAESMMIDEATSMMVGEAVLMMVDKAVSMMVGEVVLMSMGDAKSTAVAGDELTTFGNAGESMAIADEVPAMVGDAGDSTMIVNVGESMAVVEGAGKSVDPDTIIPTVGAN
jgi:hypothetical protein